MASNLWNTQSPTKRIQLYFKIDDYKKHLLSLKNAKSTFKKQSPLFLPKYKNPNHPILCSTKFPNGLTQLTQLKLRQTEFDLHHSAVQSTRYPQQEIQSDRYHSYLPYKNSGLDHDKMNSNALSSKYSPNKFRKLQQWKINQENKIIIRKLSSVKASPELSKKRLFHQYSISDLKYKINLHKTKYKNVDFTKTAEKLLKGEKINFKEIKIGSFESEKTNQVQKFEMKIKRNQIPMAVGQSINLPKAIR